MSDKKKKETQQPQEEPQEKEDSSVEENQPQEDPVEEKLRQAEEQVLALNDKLLRTLAEYDNFRKRSVRCFSASSNSGVLVLIFGVWISFDR